MKTPDQGTALRPRARLLRTIGEELISNEVVAIIELVKNAYDADATRVLIRFVGPLELGKGRIEVIDNGHGMDLSTVYAVWMELATPSKRGKIRRTEVFKRRYLGAKGIGRFASSRLAEELEVVSRVDGAGEEIYALFDWRQFDDENKYLDEILILWESRVPIDIRADGKIKALWKSAKRLPPLRKLEHGTILSMSGLKQRWEGQQFFDLKRALARLVSPTLSDEDSEHFQVELVLQRLFGRSAIGRRSAATKSRRDRGRARVGQGTLSSVMAA